MVDPACGETRRGGRADQIGEGEAVVAGAGQRRRAIAAFADGAPHVDVRKQRVPEVEPFLHRRNVRGYARETRVLPVRTALLPHSPVPFRRRKLKPFAVRVNRPRDGRPLSPLVSRNGPDAAGRRAFRGGRAAGRRVGEECVGKDRSRWARYISKKKKNK